MDWFLYGNGPRHEKVNNALTLPWRSSLSYRNQFIDLQWKSMDWFLYDRGLHHERVNNIKDIEKIAWKFLGPEILNFVFEIVSMILRQKISYGQMFVSGK